jgi:hypothetical protein
MFCCRFGSVAFHESYQVIAAGSQGNPSSSCHSVSQEGSPTLIEIRAMIEQDPDNLKRKTRVDVGATDSVGQRSPAPGVLFR